MRSARAWLAPVAGLAAVLVLMLAVSGCGDAGSASDLSPTPRPGGTYVVPLEWDPPSIEPLNVYDPESARVSRQVFEGLVRWETGSDGVVRGVPCLAEGWDVNDDATVWTFTLRKGVRFQPPVGREVTAQDVADAWGFVTDPSNASAVAYLLNAVKGTDQSGYAAKGLTGVRALDRSTLRVTLKEPFADFPLVLGHPVAGVWPLDHMEKVSREAFRNRPVGTGPYMVERWVHGEYVDLVKNPDYWDAENSGHVDRIHMPVMDVETQWEEFQKGAIDFAAVPPAEIATAQDHAKVKDGTWTAKAWPQLGLIMVGMSQKSSHVGGPTGLPLREALSRSVDRNAVVAVVDEAGVAAAVSVPATGLVPDGMPRADAGGLAYPLDAEKAAQLVEQLAPVPTLRYLSWGVVPSVTRGLSALDEPLLDGWAAAGIDVVRRGYEWNTYVRKMGTGTEGDLFLTGWLADFPSPATFLDAPFHSSTSGASTLCTFYDDPDVDRLLEEARRTLDEKRRLDLYAEAERKILDDAPVIPLYFWRDFRVANTRVQGQALDPMSTIDMWKVWVK